MRSSIGDVSNRCGANGQGQAAQQQDMREYSDNKAEGFDLALDISRLEFAMASEVRLFVSQGVNGLSPRHRDGLRRHSEPCD